jgi:hypothetical protein
MSDLSIWCIWRKKNSLWKISALKTLNMGTPRNDWSIFVGSEPLYHLCEWADIGNTLISTLFFVLLRIGEREVSPTVKKKIIHLYVCNWAVNDKKSLTIVVLLNITLENHWEMPSCHYLTIDEKWEDCIDQWLCQWSWTIIAHAMSEVQDIKGCCV